METKEDKHKFFGREHLIRAAWVIVLGLAGFIGSAAYHKFISPQKLIIDDQRQQPIPVIVKETGRDAQNPYAREIQALTAELKLFRDAFSKRQKETQKNSSKQEANASHLPTESKADPKAPDVRELTDEMRRLRDTLAKRKTQTAALTPNEVKVTPAYQLPPTVKGYSLVSPRGIIGSTCPPTTFKRGERINISFNVTDRSLLTRATPLFTRIIRKREKDHLLQVFEQVTELVDGHNALKFPVNLEPGSYYIEYGYYLRAELDQEFPKFYNYRCDFRITD